MNRRSFVPLPMLAVLIFVATAILPVSNGLLAAHETDSAAVGDTLIVDTGEGERVDAPASVPFNVESAKNKPVHLVEVIGDKERSIPAQVEPGDSPRLWWIVRGELPAKSQRTYRIESSGAAAETVVNVEKRPDAVTIRVGAAPVLRYNVAHVAPPDALDPKYGRSAHIHPCWTPSGAVVTDEFPPDHAHQSGLFLAYTKTEFEGRAPNFWDLLGGTGLVKFQELKSTAGGPVFGELNVEHEHLDLTAPAPKAALVEAWRVRVWNAGGRDAGYWICEIASTIRCATDSPLKLPAYHYGGMALRGARDWTADKARIATSDGHDRIAGNHTRPRWCDLSGPAGDREAGIAFFTHPANFRAPEPLRIHPTMPYMVYTPSQLGDWEIAPGKPHVSRYQFVFHDGELPAATMERLWRNFAEPLTAKVTKEPRTK